MTYPSYLALAESGELARRADEALRALARCEVCPRNCRVDRLANEAELCATGRLARVSSYYPHFGEEDCLRGEHGSGTIFFSFCNLKCVFCQNHDTSQAGAGREVGAERLAAMMLELQALGCHNVNFVTPEHVVPQILEALCIAVRGGLRLPLVYNTSSYDSAASLAWLDGVVDIYMPDVKLSSRAAAVRYLKAKDYPAVARRAVLEMHRQVGPLALGPHGLARRGVLVRHLVMPGLLAEAAAIFEFLATEVSPDTYVNVMDQYRPEYRTREYPEIDRKVSADELAQAYALARRAGLARFDRRDPARRTRRLFTYLG